MTSFATSRIESFCSSAKDVSLFYTTGLSPNDFLLQYSHDEPVTLSKHNTLISLSLEDHVTYCKSQEVNGEKNDCYTYLIELKPSKKILPIVNKIQAATKNTFSSSSYLQLLSRTSISLDQVYFVDSSNSTFQTGLLHLLSTKNIELETVKQFPVNEKLKRKIREFTSEELHNSEKMIVDLQKKTIRQLESLEESRNVVFGKSSREKEPTEVEPFYLLQVPTREQVQLSVINWFDHFVQTYEKNPEHSIKMLLDNRKILLSQICSHIEEGRLKQHNDCKHIPSTLPSLEFLFAILQKLYAENNITKQSLLEFLLPIENDATPTCFILEKYYYLPVAYSYIYLFSQILTERSLHSEVFLRISKSISCKHSSDSASFLRRLKRGIKFAKLDWKFHDDTRGISNLYPLLQTLDACIRNDTISLTQRIKMIFSYNKIPLQKVLEAFYKLENRMKRKDWFPLESEEQVLSLSQLEQKLQSQKERYSVILQECQKKNKEAQENRIKEKEKEIADLEKLIKEAENWQPDDDFDPLAIFTVAFSTLFRPEDPASIQRKAESARRDALREWEMWERNQNANRSYQQADPLGLLGLFGSSSSSCVPKKENEASTSAISQNSVSNHESIPSIEELTLRLENLRNDRTPPSERELNQRYQNLKSNEASTNYADIERRLQNLRS